MYHGFSVAQCCFGLELVNDVCDSSAGPLCFCTGISVLPHEFIWGCEALFVNVAS